MSLNKTKQKLLYILAKWMYNVLDKFSNVNLFRNYIINKKLYWGTTLLSISFLQSIGNTKADFTMQSDNNKVSGGNKDSTVVNAVVEEVSCYFIVVDEKATFQDGDENKAKEYIQSHIIYPKAAIVNGIEGKVIIQFVVMKTGYIDKIKIVESSGDLLLDNEAVRVIKNMPKWRPAIHFGSFIEQQFTIPVTFKLTTTK